MEKIKEIFTSLSDEKLRLAIEEIQNSEKIPIIGITFIEIARTAHEILISGSVSDHHALQ